MWEAIQKLWAVIKDPDNREALSWLGGGAVVAVGGIWAVIKFFAERKKIEQIQKPLADQLVTKDSQIAALSNQNADLTKMLVEKNRAAGPGAQQAVGQAVQSIALGAAEGDSRLQQALDLLKANKTAEAAQLLNAFAEDKTARAEQAIARAEQETAHAEQETAHAEKDRKEAAVAYRNLGTIARLAADPKRAREAYEKAVALDPEDLQSLSWEGSIPIDYGDLDKAPTRFDRVLKLAKTGDHAPYKHRVLILLGDFKQQRGDLEGALKYCQEGLAIVDRLAKSDPGSALWQRDLSVAYENVASVHRQSDNSAKALDALRQGQAIMARLTTLSPDNATWKEDLARFDRQIKELAQ